MRFTGRDHLVVGLAPGPGADQSRRVLECASGDRLAALAGTTLEEVLKLCDTVNAYDSVAAMASPRGRAVAAARVAGLLASAVAGDYRTVMLVGVETCRLADVRPPFVGDDRRLFGLHHTSGLSRWWNDRDHTERGREVARVWWGSVTSDPPLTFTGGRATVRQDHRRQT